MYRVIDDDQVQEQVDALPAEVLSAYAEARTLLEVAPWSGSPYRKEKPDGPWIGLVASGKLISDLLP